jgi:hypothetical protein
MTQHRAGPIRLAEIPFACRDVEARCEALDVPLERAGERLVEIVEVEDEVAFRRREAAEVSQVRIA